MKKIFIIMLLMLSAAVTLMGKEKSEKEYEVFYVRCTPEAVNPEENLPQRPEELSVVEKNTVFKVTAYCPCKKCSGGWGKTTASGAMAKEGRTVGVDPELIPYGSKVIIDGHEYIAEDCGAMIKGNAADIYFEKHDDAARWGVKYLKVVVIDE